MLTLFSVPKPFQGHIGIIQRNAIQSWTLLRPRPEIILFGDEEGTADVCDEFRLLHVPDIGRNDFGTPLINDFFKQAQHLSTNDLLCYVNADIILMSDFLRSVQTVCSSARRRFLMAGWRWDIDVTAPLEFEPGWEEELQNSLLEKNGPAPATKGMDYFVFPSGLWGRLPPFAVGRTAWDNWLLYKAEALGAAVVDSTRAVMAVHQNHACPDPQTRKGLSWELEASHNYELAGSFKHVYSIKDATYRLTSKGLKVSLVGVLRLHYWRRWTIHHWRHWIWFPLLSWTRPLRYRIGLRKPIKTAPKC